jgi:hypothetical protein
MGTKLYPEHQSLTVPGQLAVSCTVGGKQPPWSHEVVRGPGRGNPKGSWTHSSFLATPKRFHHPAGYLLPQATDHFKGEEMKRAACSRDTEAGASREEPAADRLTRPREGASPAPPATRQGDRTTKLVLLHRPKAGSFPSAPQKLSITHHPRGYHTEQSTTSPLLTGV